MTPVTHPSTQRQLDNFVAKPSHTVALTGVKGIGKKTLALYLSEKLLGKPILENTHEVLIVSASDTGSIGIENVRVILSFLKLKAPGSSSIKRIVIIEDAHNLTIEAQNALLKTLEEPANDTVIILTIANKNNVLTTINSRLKHINVLAPNKDDVVNYFSDQNDRKIIEKYWLISNGRIGLLTSLLSNKDHDLLPYIDQAKNILKLKLKDKLNLVEPLSKQDISQLFDALFIVSSVGFYHASAKNEIKQEKKWHQIRNAIFTAQQRFSYNTNTKLLLCNLMFDL